MDILTVPYMQVQYFIRSSSNLFEIKFYSGYFFEIVFLISDLVDAHLCMPMVRQDKRLHVVIARAIMALKANLV